MTLSVCIVIPTKDRPNYVRAASLAALADLPDNGTLIIVDDHGDRPAQNALADITDPRLQVLRNMGPRGPASARNFGVSHAKSDVILFADDDDLLKSGYVAHVTEMATKARYGFCATQSFADPPASLPAFHPAGQVNIASLPFNKQLGGLGCGFWVHRSDFAAVGGINPALRVNEDTDFSIRLRTVGLKGIFETGTGMMIRQHQAMQGTSDLGQITKRSNATDRAGYFATILSEHADFLRTQPDADRYLRKHLVKMHAKAGQVRAGMAACGKSPILMAYFAVNYLIYRISGA